jgi:hypothetical protein
LLAGTAVSNSSASVYTATSVGKDGIFRTGGGTPSVSSVGFELTGLDAGTYNVYVLTRQTNTTAAHSQIAYVSAATTAGDFNYAAYTSKTVSFANEAASVTAWVEDANYLKFTITLANTTDVLNLAVTGPVGTAERRGFLNAVQIVPVPEPMAAGMIAISAGVLGLARPRRRPSNN